MEGVVMDGKASARPEGQAGAPIPTRRETVAALAILDIFGVLATLAAAAVLALDDRTDRRWWWAVGLASLLALFTTVLLIRVGRQRRSFIEASLRLAEQLEHLRQTKIGIPDELWKLALARRDAALASGDLDTADRLTFALEGVS
jgi:hypothetical protein